MISLLKLQLEDQIVAKKGEKKYYIDKNGSVIEWNVQTWHPIYQLNPHHICVPISGQDLDFKHHMLQSLLCTMVYDKRLFFVLLILVDLLTIPV
jgi:hypothetical protein